MTLSASLACLWFVLANILAMLPSRRSHWPQAYALIAAGLPILGLVIYQHGIWWGLLVLAGAMSVLRWPLIYLARWIARKLGRG
ncbi:DUF2484 family protein [Thalassovita aquimarina]|uniref:DUF2484 family protein n=1 Tax=Thalassovita aquimarina TaxID=2785917 RepID=A0ABS5HT25_9RHOB|nr:DUF2484 family protein [Thalassovita aquimarina]